MAKDPAFLFYPGDWLGGTMTFNRHQKGCYIDLLMAQFNSGPLSILEIQDILGQDFDLFWERKLKDKFKVDEKGNFYNKRLFEEQNRRKNFSESRRKNKASVNHMNDHMNDHMNTHMETETETINENKTLIENLTTRSLNFQNMWNNWIRFRHEIKKPYKSQQAIEGQLKSLAKHDDFIACQMIQKSINNQWQGIFELDEKDKQKIYGGNNKKPSEFTEGGFGNL